MSNPSPPWSHDEADRIVAALESSGLSVAEFARQHDIAPHRLYWARRRRRNAAPLPDAAFAEFAVIDPCHSTQSSPLELRFSSGISLLIGPDFDEVTFRRILDLLSPC